MASKDTTSATSASSATNAPTSTGADRPAKMNTEADMAAAALAERNAASTDANGVASDGTATDVAEGAANASSAPASSSDAASAAAARAAAPRLIAEAAAALATAQSQRDLTEAPSVAEQAKAGTLPDPVELALKARGASGSGRRLDETIPGGLTVHPDGYFKNAHGEEIDAEGEVVEGGAQPRIDLSGARIERL